MTAKELVSWHNRIMLDLMADDFDEVIHKWRGEALKLLGKDFSNHSVEQLYQHLKTVEQK